MRSIDWDGRTRPIDRPNNPLPPVESAWNDGWPHPARSQLIGRGGTRTYPLPWKKRPNGDERPPPGLAPRPPLLLACMAAAAAAKVAALDCFGLDDALPAFPAPSPPRWPPGACLRLPVRVGLRTARSGQAVSRGQAAPPWIDCLGRLGLQMGESNRASAPQNQRPPPHKPLVPDSAREPETPVVGWVRRGQPDRNHGQEIEGRPSRLPWDGGGGFTPAPPVARNDDHDEITWNIDRIGRRRKIARAPEVALRGVRFSSMGRNCIHVSSKEGRTELHSALLDRWAVDRWAGLAWACRGVEDSVHPSPPANSRQSAQPPCSLLPVQARGVEKKGASERGLPANVGWRHRTDRPVEGFGRPQGRIVGRCGIDGPR